MSRVKGIWRFVILKNSTTVFCLIVSWSINGQTLTEYKREALENNPALKAWNQAVSIEVQKAKELMDLPDTKIGVGYFVSEPETRTGAQKARFSAQQDLPWFGTISARKKMAIVEQEITKNKLEIAKRKVILQLEKKYYELYELKAITKVLKKRDTLLSTYLQIAQTEVENGRASVVDVLKLNIAKNELQNQKEIIKGQMLTAETAMNKVLHRDGFDPLYVPDNLFIPVEEPTMLLDDISYHPEVLGFDHLQEIIDKKDKINTKESLPSIGLGIDYVIVEERSEINFPDNGKDVIMPKLTFSMPIFSKKYKARSQKYELQKEEALQRREASQNVLQHTMEKAINNRITSRINYDTQLKNIEQTKQAEEVLLAAYQTAQVDFAALLDIQQMVIDFEIKKIKAISSYFRQTAILNYLN